MTYPDELSHSGEIATYHYDPKNKELHRCVDFSELPGGKIDYNNLANFEEKESYKIGDELEFRSRYIVVSGPYKSPLTTKLPFIKFDNEYWGVEYK